MRNSDPIFQSEHTRWEENFYRADNALALAKKFVTWILMHDLFVVANILVSIILCCSDPLAMSNKASTAQLFDNMSLDIEQLLTKVC